MTKKSTKAEVNSFVQGLITEASPLNFPGNAEVDGQNFVLNRDGTLSRRFGFDLEPGYGLIETGLLKEDFQTGQYTPFKWQNVAGDADTNFLAVQIKNKVYIFNLMAESISGYGLVGTLDLAPYLFPVTTQYDFAAVDGRLVIVAGFSSIAVVTYLSGSFTIEVKKLLVRDVWGVEVTGEPAYETDDQYRGGLPTDHQYNLYNQSWGIPRSNSSGTLVDPVSNYQAGIGKYPSNSEVVWSGLDFQAVVGGTPFERLYPSLFTDTFGSKVKAARGYFIIDALNRGQARSGAIVTNKAKHSAMGMATFTTNVDSTSGGATVVTEFAGRVFFSGFNGEVTDGDKRSPSYSNHVFFSQLVKNSGDVIKCYQEGDPTSRDGSDVLDTDGGFIRIAGADNIVGMSNLGTHLIVFATNGIWAITGGSDYGFTATNYKVDRITAFGALSGSSIVEDGGTALYWSTDGIYSVAKDQYGSFVATNITSKSIQTYYEEIPTASKNNTVGVFDSAGKKIRWFYYLGTPFEDDYEAYELILDTVLGSFYKFRIYSPSLNNAIIISPFPAVPFTQTFVPDIVTVGLDTVVVGPDTVVVDVLAKSSALLSTRYLCVIVTDNIPRLSFGYFNNSDFLDWESIDSIGADAYAFLTTGAVTAGDSSATKQVPYLTLHFRRTEKGVTEEFIPKNQSGCLVRTQWDFANSANSNKWSSSFQGYRMRQVYLTNIADDPFDTGFELVTTRNKIRGRGRAFAFHMETEPSKDCQIVGWSISLNGNPVV